MSLEKELKEFLNSFHGTKLIRPDYTTNSKSYYDYLEKVTAVLMFMSKKIDDYDGVLTSELQNLKNTLDEYLEKWDENLEKFDESVLILLQEWMDDGTFEHIINHEIFQNKLDTSIFEQFELSVNQQIQKINTNLNERGVNLSSLGFLLDGVTDEGSLLQDALDTYKHILIPEGKTLATSQTIYIRQGQVLEGTNPTLRGYEITSKIKFIGNNHEKKSVIVLGKNEVGSEPILDASNVVLKNLSIDVNNKAGFGVYGTYITNDSIIDNVLTENALEYGQFYARSWYARFENLINMRSRNIGIAFGMPLEYLDGTKSNWETVTGLEMNNVVINNIRSVRAGMYYIDNPGIYTPVNELHRRKGYGVGLGIGNGFNVETVTAELSGGVNVYVYTDSQPVKTIRRLYMERSCENSGLNPTTTLPNMIIEHLSDTGGAYTIEDLFMNYNSGGIYHTGKKRPVWIRNAHQPRFLKSLDGLHFRDLYQFILKENVFYECGTYNTLHSLGYPNGYEEINTTYEWEIKIPTVPNCVNMVYIKTDTIPHGFIYGEKEDGTLETIQFPTSISSDDWIHVITLTDKFVRIAKGGSTGTVDRMVFFKIIRMGTTTI